VSAGRDVALSVAGAWRPAPPPLRASSERLADLVPLLVRGGVGALVWRRVRLSELTPSPRLRELQEAHRLNVLQAAVQQRALRDAVVALASAGIDPLLGKGWAMARLYPERGLRPAGDVDLYVRPDEVEAARAALDRSAVGGVDLHSGVAELDDRRWDALCGRSVRIAAGEAPVRTFAPDDHFRLVALHMLRHGAWRPLWLCDVGAALESTASPLDWDRVLAGDPRRARAVGCAARLAQELLGARLDGAPAAVREARLPRWVVSTVLRQWGDPRLEPQSRRRPFSADVKQAGAMLEALVQRWPNPIEATLNVGGPFNDLPRLPFQLAECVRRTAGFAGRAAARRSDGRGPAAA